MTCCTRLALVLIAAMASAVQAAPPEGAKIVEAQARARGGGLEVRLTTAGEFAAAVTHVLIDTDSNAGTGLASEGAGFDVLVEGDNLFRFAGGDPTEWKWQPVGQATRRVQGKQITIRVEHESLLGRQIRLLTRTLDEKYQALDRGPAQGLLSVEMPQVKEGTEAAGDADDPKSDLTDVKFRQDGGQVVIELTARQASDFGTALIFLQRAKANKGYRPTGSSELFELLITGNQLMEHVGDDPAAWQWSEVAGVERVVSEQRLTIRLDAGQLGSASVRGLVMMMSADWLTLLDRAPDRGLYELSLDLSKVKAVTRPAAQMAPAKANRELSVRQRTAQAKSFYTYYGSGQVAALSHYDLVIAHSPQMKLADIKTLRDLGVVTVGYITVGEDETLRRGDGSGPGGNASWYLDRDKDGKPDQNAVWKSYFANPLDAAWRADRVAEARRLVEQEGYDGIFLDTIDTVQRYPDTEPGMVQLLRELREALPTGVIILNQGYSLLDQLAPYADALMLESFTATYDFQSGQYMLNTPNSLDYHSRMVDKYIRPALAKHPLKVLVLDYARPGDVEAIQAAADRAATFGFLFAVAPIHLDRVYQLDIVGRADPRWLEKQATPQRLSVTLAQGANGFPAGTTILPSGCFAGYAVGPVVDGVENRAGLHWSKAAWASAEDGEEAWLELRFPQPVAGGTLEIVWAVDENRPMTSRRYEVQVRGDSQWRTVAKVARDETAAADRHALPVEPFEALRIRQPADGGSEARPNLMWIGQIRRIEG